MRLRHIEIFHAIYSTGSITNAAKFLNVSQPSVSKVLAHAEMQLGFQLFARVKGRLVATPEAEMLFSEADRIFNQMANINDLAENILHHRTGKLSLGITMALGFDVVPRITKQFLAKFPEVKVELTTLHNQNIHNHLIRQQSDLAIMFAPRKLPDVVRYEFGTGQLVAVLPNSHDYPADKRVDIGKIKERPYISIRNSGPLGDLVNEHIEKDLSKLRTIIQVDTYYVAAQMVKQGLGWCVIDEFTARANSSEDVRIHHLKDPISFPIVGLCSDIQPVSKLTEEFIKFSHAYFGT